MRRWSLGVVAAGFFVAGCDSTAVPQEKSPPASQPVAAAVVVEKAPVVAAAPAAASPKVEDTPAAAPATVVVTASPAVSPPVVPIPVVKTDPNHKPTLFCIGDSTMKNGADNGATMGEWGYGHILHYYFDPAKITVENDAVGGTSSRLVFETANMWPRVLAKLQPGDFVLMQFGHNDDTRPPESDTLRYRSTIKGNGEETVQGPVQGGGMETIHSFGWYMRQYCIQTKGKGASPVIVSFIPRNSWQGGKKNPDTTSYSLWAEQAAEQEHAFFVPLNKLVVEEYNKLGQAKVTADLFPAGETTHTTWAGAALNAQCVAAGLKGP